MSANPTDLDNFLASISAEKSDDAKTIVQMVRDEYPQAQVTVRWDMATFDVHGTIIVGISAKDDFGVLIPHSGLVRKYLPRLGNVRHDDGCLRFNALSDIDLEELGSLISEIGIRLFSRE